MGRFASTVDFYERTRAPYGEGFFAALAREVPLTPDDRLIDLGTGPGLIALGLARYVGELWGVDPEPAMLAWARANAERQGVVLTLIEGAVEDLTPDSGTFDVVTIGRALHWMDPQRTRPVLDRIVRHGGCILVCSASSAADGRNPWLADYEALRERWCADPGFVRHRDRHAFFGGTRFHPAATIEVVQDYAVTPESLAQRVLSMSSTSPEKLGANSETVRREAQDLLAPYADGGLVRDIVLARAEVFRSEPPRSVV